MAKAVLLPYQQRWIADKSQVKVWEKSRRIGASWCEAADAALTSGTKKSAGGMDTWYIGYNKEMAEEFIRDTAFWAKHFDLAARKIEEFILQDPDKDILAFRVKFASGFRVIALSSRPSNLRGKQGKVIIDEAAFHDDLQGLLDAALALLMWGGRVSVLSTHFGEDNYFNELVQDIRAGKKPYSLHRTTLDDAIKDGLYKRICLKQGKKWSKEAEEKWRQDLIDFYGDAADQELFCIPSKSGGAYLTRNIIESCMDPSIPVIRFSPPSKDFVDWPDDKRYREVKDWCKAELEPVLKNLPDRPSWFGEDFAREGDLTVIWPIQQMPDLMAHTPFLLELRDCPFTQQEQILFYVGDRLPRFSGGALDKGGNGAYLAERARQQYGEDRIEQVHFHDSWNLENWPRAKAALEDNTVTIPKDSEVLEDFRAVKVIKGVPKVPRDSRTKSKHGGQRHGDAAIAFVLAIFAMHTLGEHGPVEYKSIQKRRFSQRGAW